MRRASDEFHLPIVDGPGQDERSLRPTRRPLLCLSHLRWDFVRQRPQHLMSRAARDYDVTFFEEPLFEAVERPVLRLSHDGAVTVAVPVLPHGTDRAATDDLQRVLLDGLVERTGQPAALWYYTPMAMPFSRHLEADIVVYDNMDELSAFRGASPEMLRNEDELFARADVVFTGGFSLFEAKRDRHERVFAFPSSIDAAHFATARDRRAPEPADQADIPSPRLGFFGVIDERLDLDLVAGVARARPDWHLVMIGPVVKIDAGSLPQAPNIHWLGQKHYDSLPAYLAGWDVGLMPFALNEATRFISPTKTPEYLAAGVPVVSTPIRDVIRPYGEKDLVAIADDPGSVIAAAARAMARADATWLARVDRHLSAGSWDRTWADMRQAMEEASLAGPAPRVANDTVPTLVAAE